jgi:pimeloyl-ACP methyl ester carboxylesterase
MTRNGIASVAAAATVVACLTVGAPRAQADPLTWGPCVTPISDVDCAYLTVPMDRRDPGGPTFRVAVARHKSTGSAEKRIGTLVFIPGGPGGSGVSQIGWVWMSLPLELRDRFDLVSWDPRGTGNTTPAAEPCLASDEYSVSGKAYRTGPIDWAAYSTQGRAYMTNYEVACEAANRQIAPHLGSNANASDLDAIRRALGEEQLTLWGVSFGTRIGAVYAQTYPEHVRSMLLDGPMNPSSGWPPPEYNAPAGAKAFEWVARYFPAAGRQFRQVLDHVTRHPVNLGDGVWVDRYSAPQYIYADTGVQERYSSIARRIDQLHDAVFATGEAQRAAQQAVRLHLSGAVAGAYTGEVTIVGLATFCLDTAARPTVEERQPLAQRMFREYGAFEGGRVMSPTMSCYGFSFPPDPIPLAADGSGPALPTLVYGSSQDPFTPGPGITALRKAFPGARSVTYRGTQHMVWTVIQSSCVTRPGIDFLLPAQEPSSDSTCANTYRKPGSMVG